MKTFGIQSRSSSKKAATGIAGFDQMTGGGLPGGRVSLIQGGPGSGKTMFALQFLRHGATACGEPGVFVAFEESPDRIVSNFADFGWGLEALQPRGLSFIPAQPSPDLIQSGEFDLTGMLAALGARMAEIGARRVVFDALDVMLALLPDLATKRREVYRLHEWLLDHDITGIITAKAGGDEDSSLGEQPFGFMQFMVDCAVILNHRVAMGVSQRNLRIQKYRGSSFEENESPFIITGDGFDVAISTAVSDATIMAPNSRVSSGIERLDTMLGGGYYRAASILITGFPGTAKTTLSGAFLSAACQRGERALFISFDSDGAEVVRNLASVGIELGGFVENGLLKMVSARTISGSAESLLVRIRALARESQAQCVVIDPISALAKSGNELTAFGVVERLVDWSKTEGITLVCTSLLDETPGSLNGATPLQISTLADTWIHLNYLLQAGERNRGLSIIKSRGTPHSNQVRELILSNEGVTLADIYSAGGEVLMGAMRWEKENSERVAGEVANIAGQLKRVSLEADEAILEVRLTSLQAELKAKRVEKALLDRTKEELSAEMERRRLQMRELRSADATWAEPADGVA